jgi:hypothetical protein
MMGRGRGRHPGNHRHPRPNKKGELDLTGRGNRTRTGGLAIGVKNDSRETNQY